MVGRENELKELQTFLSKAAYGEGNTIFISGEAGIGKTRLVNELKQIAQSKGFQILSGNSMYESLTPFMPIMETLRSGGLESLFAEEAPKVEAVYLVTHGGVLIKDVLRKETKLSPVLFTSMLTVVGNFVTETLSILSEEKKEGALNTLGYENFRILIESGKSANLVVLLTGKENEFLIEDMREIKLNVEKEYETDLRDWDGDEKSIQGIEKILSPLIASGKYDGIYYGKEDPKIRRNLLFENVSMGLARHAKTAPTLLSIEDLQWADPSSIALMHYIGRNTKDSGLLILGTYRPEDVASEDGKGHPLIGTMQLMDREDLLEKMDLARLPEESIDEFLTSMLQKIDFTDDFKKKIYKETEGNPLFVIELIKFLVDESIIQNIDGTWKLTKPLEEGTIPSKVLSVISRRLDRVEKEDRKALDYASVIGEVFDSTLLADILEMDRVRLLEKLRYIEKIHRLIHPQNGNFKFDHAKIKETLYNEVPQELKSEYHLKAANSLETLNKDNFDKVIEDLAFHYYQSKNREKAVFYLYKAAEKAKKDFANEEAIRFYFQALEFEDDMQKRTELFEIIGDIYELIGDYQNGIKLYKHALELSNEDKKKAEVMGKMGTCFNLLGEFHESLRTCSEALSLIGDDESKEKSDALNGIGRTYLSRGDIDKALEYFRKSLKIREKIADNKGRAGSLNNLGLCYSQCGEYNKALEYYKKSLDISKRMGDLRFTANHLINIGISYREMMEYELSFDNIKGAQRIFEKIGNQNGFCYSLNNIGVIYCRKGEYEEAINIYQKCIKINKRTNLPEALTQSYCDLAYVNLKLNNIKKALEYSDIAFNLSKEKGYKEYEGIIRRNYGMIFIEKKNWKKSSDNFKESINIFKEIGFRKELAESHFEFGLMWKAKGDSDKAKEHLNTALDIFEKLKLEKWAEKVKAELETL
jgi:tetratricopeptide (TPR) repeat protein